MRKQDYLIELIKSMSPNERRYFKLFSGLQPGEKRYMQLFDALENEESYDTKKLCKVLDVAPKRLADDKYYLTQALLKSFRNVDEFAWKHPQFYKQVIDADNLLDRGLVDLAMNLLDKSI